jgi:hypothetical protein
MQSRRLILPIFLSIGCFFALFASPSAALPAGPKADVFLGYSRLNANTFYPNVGGLNGWTGAMHVKLKKPFLGVEADVAQFGLGASATVPKTTTVMAGPRLTVGAMGFHVFAHGLAGGEHSSSSTGISGGALVYALGGGLDVPIAPFFSWRVAGDYLSAPTQSPATGSHSRISTGLVFRF